MKSIEQQLSEAREAIFAAELKKGFTEAATQTAWNDKMKSCSSVEQKLSVAKKHLAELGITESKKIVRNAGSGVVVESDKTTQRIQEHVKRTGKSWTEASIFMTGAVVADPGDKNSELRESWRRYCPSLRPEEIAALVQRKVPVPTR